MSKKIVLIILSVIEVLLCVSLILRLAKHTPKTERISSCTELPERCMNSFEKELYQKSVEVLKKVSLGDQDCLGGVALEISALPENAEEVQNSADKVQFFLKKYVPEYTYWADSIWVTEIYGEMYIGYRTSPVYMDDGFYGFGEYGYLKKDVVETAQRAFDNAKRIAKKYENKSDYEKVCGYAEEICKAVKYDDNAADSEDFSDSDIRPWRIVSVFDEDPETNVVCEAYGQAFEYLCGLGGIECWYISGEMGGGSHGWNTVVLDGVSYFTDITACDTTNYTDAEIKIKHPFILEKVADVSTDGFKSGHYKMSSFYYDEYTYGESAKRFLPEEILLVSTKKYRTNTPLVVFIILDAAAIAFMAVKQARR